MSASPSALVLNAPRELGVRAARSAAARCRSGAHSHALLRRQRRERSCRSIAARIRSCTGASTRPRASSCTRTRRAGPIRCAISATRKSARSSKSAAPCDDLHAGQRVFGTWGHRTHHVATRDYVRDRLLPDGADPRIGIFSHIGAVALNGVHDAAIRMGDLVVVFGLGVPGQIVAQAARASGATVIGVDPVT